jgi:hypothetical protein
MGTSRTPVGRKNTKNQEGYTISPDGHYVGIDGFVVPKNFQEYYERNPMGVRRFLMKKLHKQMVDEAVLDMEQDLLLFLHYLPEKSKHRKEGKTDIIQCFDPLRHHGASAKRFHNYIALCLSNRFCTLLHKQKRNPIYNKYNLSIQENHSTDDTSVREEGTITPDKLPHVMAVKNHVDASQTEFQRLFIEQFKSYIQEHAPDMLPTIEAIANTESLKEAQKTLGLRATPRVFHKQRERLNTLKNCFLKGIDYKRLHGVIKLDNLDSFHHSGKEITNSATL